MKFSSNFTAGMLAVVMLFSLAQVPPAQANCFTDFDPGRHSKSYFTEAWGWAAAFTGCAAATGLLLWGIVESGRFANENENYIRELRKTNLSYSCPMNTLYIDNRTTLCGNAFATESCKDFASHCLSLNSKRSGGITGCFFGSIAEIPLLWSTAYAGVYFMDACSRGFSDCFRARRVRKEWQKQAVNTQQLVNTCNIKYGLNKTLKDIYERVGLPMGLNLLDIYYNLLIYGIEGNQICPDGKFFNKSEIEAWLKNKRPITEEDFNAYVLLSKGTQNPAEHRELFNQLKHEADHLNRSIFEARTTMEKVLAHDDKNLNANPKKAAQDPFAEYKMRQDEFNEHERKQVREIAELKAAIQAAYARFAGVIKDPSQARKARALPPAAHFDVEIAVEGGQAPATPPPAYEEAEEI